jgi:(1->4)-alpha-D-glucan 1-alpha-D-glucosylmutase
VTTSNRNPSDNAARAAAPVSTYRLQLHAGFTFENARQISDYLHQLGVSHAYTSPYLKASPGSTHGYDVIDHSMVNPEIGTDADRARWVESLKAHGLSHVIDVVPNHMGVSSSENRWWNDVLEYGPQSEYADYFDIAWDDPPRPASRGKVLLPILGDRYSRVVRGGEIALRFDREGGSFALNVYDRALPVTPRSYAMIFEKIILADVDAAVDETPEAGSALKSRLAELGARDAKFADKISATLEAFNGRDGAARFETLHRLLEAQNYRLVHWLSTNGEINYRRFFDVPSLAALRMEKQSVFDEAHALIRRWVNDGSVTGLRIDHPDGLANPAEYFERLQTLRAGKPIYVVAEKILGAEESLVSAWPIAGTSGYDFLNQVNGLFVDPSADEAMTKTYESFIGKHVDYRALVIHNKKRICDEAMAGELTMLAERLDGIAQANVDARDYSFVQIRMALRELVASFPVYRTYVSGGVATEWDRRYIAEAIDAAKKGVHRTHHDLIEFVHDTLLGSSPEQRQFAERFQQFTSPVMAKGVEDTTFYQYNRLLSLNEVGGEPEQFGLSPAKVHTYFERRAREWPGSMSTLSTHDTKRSEDVRARLNVLSEMPARWAEAVGQWSRMNAHWKTPIDGKPSPDANDEFMIYQLLLGVWPAGASADAGADETLAERIIATLRKSLREAKANTSWLEPNEPYEDAAVNFTKCLFDRSKSAMFLDSFVALWRDVAAAGVVNSLAQSMLKLAAPGVPDTYQGSELFDLSLVDPDNRRPVDFDRRRQLLGTLDSYRATLREKGFDPYGDGADAAKLLVHSALLRFRRDHADLMSTGEYVPIHVKGPRADNVFAFERRHGSERLLIIAPRLVAKEVIARRGDAFSGDEWRDTRITITNPRPPIDVLSGLPASIIGTELSVGEALRRFPVAAYYSVMA